MAAVQLVGAEADDHQHASAVQRAHEKGDEVERRPIRPVQILDHEHERAVGGQPLDHAYDQLEQPRRAALTEGSPAERAVGIEVRQHLRQLGAGRPDELIELLGRRVAHQRAECVRERAERQAIAAHLDAAAREHPRARLARALGGLLDESCLAHAGLATQEHDRRVARDRSVERGRQRRQLGVSSDEDRTDESASHRAHVLSLRRGRLGLFWLVLISRHHAVAFERSLDEVNSRTKVIGRTSGCRPARAPAQSSGLTAWSSIR